MAKRSKEYLRLLENIHAIYSHTEYTEDQYIAQLLDDDNGIVMHFRQGA